MPRTVLVTGATGFVGRHLMPALSAAFPEARLVPTSRRSGRSVAGIEAARLDLTQPQEMRSALSALAPDAIVHLAGIASPRQAALDPRAARQANRDEPIALAEIVRTMMPDALFVFVSSAAIYGRSALSGSALDESAALLPLDAYGETKAEADRAIGEMAEAGLRAIRLRPFNHTGPGQPLGYAIPDYASQIARAEAEGPRAGPIRARALDDSRDFLDVRDVCSAYVEAIRHAPDLPAGIALNIASGVPRRLGDVLDRMLALAGVRAAVECEPDSPGRGGVPHLWGNASKARTLLAWEPKVPFDQTLLDTIAWWREEITRSALQRDQ